ncbi:hypothetical protein NIES4071_105000 (plasmid) [Calothrix sp. NIES-4071]|nr:hypothetical protein NIES4071_105000 [Calothrix sp. NIES-4071]BAZ64918.1 hypothetical protein NIES4105_106510 [Calothrix sp. NIES-4105]
MVTQNQGFRTASSNTPSTPVVLNYSFNYDRFENLDLKNRAKSTLGSFFGFIGATLDGLLGIGRMLRELYNDCVAFLPDGKKVFEQWIKCEDFGASQYLAKSSMEIAGWFDGLQPIRQESIRSKVQKWSVSALVQLSKVADKFLESVINGGKKTAAQVKRAATTLSGFKIKNNNALTTKTTSTEEVNPAELAPGMRIIVKTNDAYNGSTGEIKERDGNNFWVLLDYTATNGGVASMLFKPEQLAPEPKIVVKNKSKSERLFTIEEVEQEVQKRLDAFKRDFKEEMLGETVKAQEAGEKAALSTIKSYEQRALSLEKANQELRQQLSVKEQELVAIRSKQAKNQQLEQRVAELEQALESLKKDSFEAPLSHKVNDTIHPNFVLLLPVLIAEVKDLKDVVSTQEQELVQLKAMNAFQQEEINNGRQYVERNTDIEAIIKEFGYVGESLGWSGWNRYGYRAVDGTLHKDINAIASFISDLKQNYYETNETVFQN